MNLGKRLLRAACILGVFTASAQTGQDDNNPLQPAGRWRLHTDAATRTTVVAFYDDRDRLIYEETLPNRHVRLSRRNIRRLDEACARLVARQVVASAVASARIDPGLSEHPEPTGPRAALRPGLLPDSAVAGLRTNLIPANGKITVFFSHSGDGPVQLLLLDPQDRPIYKEASRRPVYRRSIDLAQLNRGEYRLIIASRQYRYSYRLSIPESGPYFRPDIRSLAHGPARTALP